MSRTYAERIARLFARLDALDDLLVAFSGGVDSSALLGAARERLGERCAAVVADSPSLPRRELADAEHVARALGARLFVVRTDELDDPRYRANRGERCYFCKSALFDAMELVAGREGFRHLAFGEIADDALDDRPGARAARERGILAPLADAGLGKDDVRRFARERGLAVASKPASACLASRIPVGTPVDAERLARVEAAEDALVALGLRELRVRDRGPRARLEVGAGELEHARARAAAIGQALAAAGYEGFELALYVPPAERVPAAP